MNNSAHEIVVVIPENPGDYGGYKVAIKSMLRVYERAFGRLLIFSCDSESIEAFDFLELNHRVIFVERSISSKPLRYLQSILFNVPATSVRYQKSFAKIQDFLIGLNINPKWIIFEDVTLASWLPRFRAIFPNAKVLVRSHDIMSLAYKPLVRKGPILLRVLWSLELYKIKKAERQAYLSADIFVPISSDDSDSYSKKFGPSTSKKITVGVSFDTSRYSSVAAGDPHTFVCVGSFDLRKSRGFVEFLKKSWPVVLKKNPDAKLILAGLGSEKFTSRANRVSGLGWVRNDIDVLNMGSCFLNPQNEGSGIQIKSLVALASGKQLFSLELGVTGIESNVKKFAIVAKNYHDLGAVMASYEGQNQDSVSLQKESCRIYSPIEFTKRAADDLVRLIEP